jgi:hypothetical protein
MKSKAQRYDDPAFLAAEAAAHALAQRVQSLEAQLAAAEKEIKEMHELDIKITEAEWCRKYRDACIFISEQADRIAAAEKDKARLDWLDSKRNWWAPRRHVDGYEQISRDAIDDAIAAAKPARPGKLEGET